MRASSVSAILSSQTPSGHALFEQALAKERVDGNLLEAIKLLRACRDGVRVGPQTLSPDGTKAAALSFETGQNLAGRR